MEFFTIEVPLKFIVSHRVNLNKYFDIFCPQLLLCKFSWTQIINMEIFTTEQRHLSRYFSQSHLYLTFINPVISSIKISMSHSTSRLELHSYMFIVRKSGFVVFLFLFVPTLYMTSSPMMFFFFAALAFFSSFAFSSAFRVYTLLGLSICEH